VVGISTSEKSENILMVLNAAKNIGIKAYLMETDLNLLYSVKKF